MEAVPRLAADALNQMRGAIEHALFAEVEQMAGRKLEPSEAQDIEMPVKTDSEGLAQWFKAKAPCACRRPVSGRRASLGARYRVFLFFEGRVSRRGR